MITVDQLYDSLFAVESRFRKGVYPIHKRIKFHDAGVDDIYDWIIANVRLPDEGNVVDAGCGVGFGTLRLAESCSANLLGLTLSGAEFEYASRSTKRLGCEKRIRFSQMSYDELPNESADIIIAVESLKHSDDLGHSLNALLSALRSGGTLVIVEDLYSGPERHPSARNMANDWGLTRVHTETDFTDLLPRGTTVTFDLTPGMTIRENWHTTVGVAFLGGLATIVPHGARRLLAAYRGGLSLNRLYAEGLMSYKAMIFTKPGTCADR